MLQTVLVLRNYYFRRNIRPFSFFPVAAVDWKRILPIYLDVAAAAAVVAVVEAAVEILRRRLQLPRPGRSNPRDHFSLKRISFPPKIGLKAMK